MANAFSLIDPQNSSLKRRDCLRAARLGGTVCLAFISVAFGGGIEVPQWTRFEVSFTSAHFHQNPVQEVQLQVDFTSPGGKSYTILSFWNGGTEWKVRFSPDEPGRWRYRTRCSVPADAGLHGRKGEFKSTAYQGANPLYRHGAVVLSENRHYLIHQDGTPFFWLADTAWNGVLLAEDSDWRTYLNDRKDKGFTAVQFVTTQWKAAAADQEGRVAFSGRERISIHPDFFKRMDKRIDAINDHGMIAAPVLLWANPYLGAELNPGIALPEDQMIVLGQYLVARYGAHQVVWILNGDGDYLGEKARLWKNVGRGVFKYNHPRRLATLHPSGRRSVFSEFRDEKWFGFNGYYSGHTDDEKSLRWLLEGAPSREWRQDPTVPHINLEINYERHLRRGSTGVFDAHAIRRAAYWSLLIAPPAGVTYGAHGLWYWHLKPEEPLNHRGTGIAPPWPQAMQFPGSTQMKYLKDFFTSTQWWKLRPAQELLVEQPGREDASDFVVVAKSTSNDFLVAYLPKGGSVRLRIEELKLHSPVLRWFNPRTGDWFDGQFPHVAGELLFGICRRKWLFYA